MIVGVPRERAEGEKRVALVPEALARIRGASFLIEQGAGEAAGFPDASYSGAGATVVPDPRALYEKADLILKVQPPAPEEAGMLKEGSSLVSFLYPLGNLELVKLLAARRATVFAMDLMPRISRAQSMDALSSQSTVCGYKAAVMAADALPKLFPLLMTAAGTVTPARVFVLGAGVAGLQAIATARRLGALVEAYDVRPAVKEQIESLGAKFVELPVEAAKAQDAGGYATAQSDEFYRRQQQLLAEHAAASDAVITTALVPGKRAPTLLSEEAVNRMRPGSVVVDLAAEQGGNCALTKPGETVVRNGVTIFGPLNLPSTMAPQSSLLYARNLTSFLSVMLKDGKLVIDTSDEVVRGTLVLNAGAVANDAVKKALEASP